MPYIGNFPAGVLTADSVDTAALAANAVTTSDISDSAVTTIKLNDLAVTTSKLEDSAVTTAKINDSSVTTAKIAAGNVTTSLLNDGAVTTDKIGSSAVTTAKIATGNVTTTLIADSAVTTAKININSDLAFNGANVSNVGLGATVVTSSSNVLTLNFGNSQVFTCTLTEDTTITPSNIPVGGCVMLLKLTNGGDYTVSYSGNAMFAADTAPTLTASGVDYLLFVCTTADSYAVTPSITNVI